MHHWFTSLQCEAMWEIHSVDEVYVTLPPYLLTLTLLSFGRCEVQTVLNKRGAVFTISNNKWQKKEKKLSYKR